MLQPRAELCLSNLISEAECTDIVRKSFRALNPRVISFTVAELEGRPGFLGDYLLLTVVADLGEQYDGESRFPSRQVQETYFVKTLPLRDQQHRKMILEYGMFGKEVAIYSQIFEKFGNNEPRWHPRCFLAREDLLVLEELQRTQGFRHMPYRSHCEKSHMELVLCRLACLHAESLNYEYNVAQGKRLDEVFGKFLFETSIGENNEWFMAGINAIQTAAVTVSKYADDPNIRPRIETEAFMENIRSVFDLVKSTDSFKSVLVHRDVWHNNVMFKFKDINETDKPIDCVLIDFQICRYLPPAVDILFAIYLNTTRANRAVHFHEYVQFYYSCLQQRLAPFGLSIDKILPQQDYLRSLEHFKLLALTYAGVCTTLVCLPNGVLNELYNEKPELYHLYCNVDRRQLVLKYLQEDNYYREAMKSAVEEMLEYLFDL